MTHSNDPGSRLAPFTTPQSILDDVSRNHLNHNLANYCGGSNYKQWDATQITKCITCSGGQNSSHPSGERSLTHAELAALQGFPAHHTFHGTARRKQIGNAVPPMVHQKLLNWLVEKLKKADEREAAVLASAALALAVPAVIDLTGN